MLPTSDFPVNLLCKEAVGVIKGQKLKGDLKNTEIVCGEFLADTAHILLT